MPAPHPHPSHHHRPVQKFSLNHDSAIRVICQDEEQSLRLQREFAVTSGQDQVSLSWQAANPQQLFDNNAVHKLTIAAVASPDPTTVLWEDCSKPWVQALNLESSVSVNSEEIRCIHGPRYLMPADDAKWAVHEIIAADQAMRCWVEIAEEF